MRAPVSPLLLDALRPDPQAAGGRREQLYLRLRDAVLSGLLPAGSALPGTRVLATALGLARSGVVEVVEQLVAEGYLVARQGAATRVANLNAAVQGRRDRRLGCAGDSEPDEVLCRRWPEPMVSPPFTELGFRPGHPDISTLPEDRLAYWMARVWRDARLRPEPGYQHYTGLPALRAQVLEHLALHRQVKAQPEQVLIVPGSQAAFDLVARVVLQPGDIAVVEDPGYLGLRAVLSALPVSLQGQPVDAEGMCLEGLPANSRLIGVTPSHHYPLGSALSLSRRLALIEHASRHDALILEDDYDSEYQFSGPPLASLQGLDDAGRVFHVGTFSKLLAPGLRMAWLVVPPAWVDLARSAAITLGLGVSLPQQAAVAAFMQEGGLRRHVRQMRPVYAARFQALAEAFEGLAMPGLHFERPAGGLQLALRWATGRADDRLVAAELNREGLAAAALSPMGVAQPVAGLVFGIGRWPAGRFEACMNVVRAVLSRHLGPEQGAQA